MKALRGIGSGPVNSAPKVSMGQMTKTREVSIFVTPCTVFPWRHDRLSDREEVCMEAIVERCAGIDIGQATVVVTVLVGAAHQRPRKTTRTFRTITRELLELREWLRAEQVTHV